MEPQHDPQSRHPHSRRHFIQALAAGAILGTSLPAKADVAAGSVRDRFDVREFGAVGDGKADDTDAFHKAIDAAAAMNPAADVVVPPGTYRITSSLTIKSMLMIGSAAGGWPADSRPLPTIQVEVPAPDPCIIAELGTSLHGLCFNFPRADDPRREFGPCIQLKGGGVSLTNLLLHNPTEGIMWDGASGTGRLNLENIFIVNPRKCGVYVAYTLDVATLRNVEVWNYIRELVATTTGFRLGANDEIRISHCAVVAAAIGFHFVDTPLPGDKPRATTTWGGMDNCTVDASAIGVQIDTARILRITGGSIWAHHFGVIVNGRSNVILTGVDLHANSDHCLHVRDCDSVTVTGCLFKKGAPDWPNTAKVQINAGGSVLISGCTFDETSTGITIQPEAKRFSVTGNLFAKMTYPAIQDRSTGDANKIVAQNLMG